MTQLFDLSHPIRDIPPCTFRTTDAVPQVRFSEGEAHAVTFITSRIDNLYSNTCTHIDFPGHISQFGSRYFPDVGSYPIDRFIGKVAVLDFSSKVRPLMVHFKETGEFLGDPGDSAYMFAFLKALDNLEITEKDLTVALDAAKTSFEQLKGVLIYSGLSRFWTYQVVESWNHAYFFNPFFSENACQRITDARLSFVGIDCLQVEHPIINFAGDEIAVVQHPDCRAYISGKLDLLGGAMNHKAFLGRDVLIYENMRIPEELRGKTIWFSGVPLNLQLRGLDDNALARPYAQLTS